MEVWGFILQRNVLFCVVEYSLPSAPCTSSIHTNFCVGIIQVSCTYQHKLLTFSSALLPTDDNFLWSIHSWISYKSIDGQLFFVFNWLICYPLTIIHLYSVFTKMNHSHDPRSRGVQMVEGLFYCTGIQRSAKLTGTDLMGVLNEAVLWISRRVVVV